MARHAHITSQRNITHKVERQLYGESKDGHNHIQIEKGKEWQSMRKKEVASLHNSEGTE